MAEGRVRGFSIATKCGTVEELIEKYRDRVDERSILVHTVEAREIGTECAFAILLADKQVALAGTCTVMDVFTDATNPFKRPGMRLGIQRLGPASERVWNELLARRIAPRSGTMALPLVAVVPPRTSTRNRGVQRAAPASASASAGMQTALQTADVAREPLRRLSTIQIPPRDSSPQLDTLARVPRATPRSLDDQKPLPPPPPVVARPVETRTPGSAYILPANPLMNLTDASLEGFVDCKIIETLDTPPPSAFPAGTRDELSTVPPSAPMLAAAAVPVPLEPMRSEPLPLPPPPPSARQTASAIAAALYHTTELPHLAVETNDRVPNVRVPLVPKRLRIRLLLAITLVPLLGAGAVVLYMQLAATRAVTAAPAMPATVAVVEPPLQAHASVEPPPPAPLAAEPAPPARPQPIHMVLVRTYPIAARVTVGGRSFGTTPTYVKIPANTPVELQIKRPGFKPVSYPFVSKKRTDRVFVRLQRAPKGKR